MKPYPRKNDEDAKSGRKQLRCPLLGKCHMLVRSCFASHDIADAVATCTLPGMDISAVVEAVQRDY